MRRREDFAQAVRRGKRAGRRHLVAHIYLDHERAGSATAASGDDGGAAVTPKPARAGFVVNKAVGGSVVRNRVKRQLRHLVRQRLVELPPGSLVVIRALPPAAHADADALGTDLDAALRRLLGRSASGARR